MRNVLKQLKKVCAIIVMSALVVAYSLPVRVLAQEVTPDPTPTPTQTEITNDSSGTNNTDTTANTGDNTIGEPTPTPTPEALTETSPTPTPEPTLDPSSTPGVEGSDASLIATNSAEVTNNSTSSADSGNNQIETTGGGGSGSGEAGETSEESTPTPTPTSQINTGTAVAVTTVDNAINTTEINSQVVYQTINLFVDQNGDINLSDPEALIRFLTLQNPESSVINVALTKVTNTASVNNSLNSQANSGNNQINGAGGDAAINTGDAYSLIAALNRINLVMIDSVLHIVTINIFGNFSGNIILPENTTEGEPCSDCSSSTNIDNSATVTNNVDSTAVSGQNSISASGSADITSGQAVSLVQLTNLVNTNLIGVNLFRFVILPLGVWNGSFLGWGDLAGQPGGGALALSSLSGVNGTGCPDCVGDINLNNQAHLTNNISSSANTGGNSISGENAAINTGRAVSLVSLMNFVNTNLVRSVGFFGFINVFGSWTGDVGGASFFPTPTPTPAAETTSQSSTDESTNSVRDSGGLLSITQTNNVGEYVLPGDTVTFFIKVKNIGNGRVYDSQLSLELIKDGVNMGGALFSLGTIDPGKGAKITTGLVLSKTAPPGTYLARATVQGRVGPDNHLVKAVADSSFVIFGHNPLAAITSQTPPAAANLGPATVLGTTQTQAGVQANVLRALLVLLLLAPLYTLMRVVQKKELFGFLFSHQLSWQLRLRALQLFLL